MLVRIARFCSLVGLFLFGACATPETQQSPIAAPAVTQGFVVWDSPLGAVISVPSELLFDASKGVLRSDADPIISRLSFIAQQNSTTRFLLQARFAPLIKRGGLVALTDSRLRNLHRSLSVHGLAEDLTTIVGAEAIVVDASFSEQFGMDAKASFDLVFIGLPLRAISFEGGVVNAVGGLLTGAVSSLNKLANRATLPLLKFENGLRAKFIGPATICTNEFGVSIAVIDRSTALPAVISSGQDVQHIIDAQLCLLDSRRRVEQGISVLSQGNVIFRSPRFMHDNMPRSRQQFFTLVGVPAGASKGFYQIESVVRIDGRSFKHVTSFEVR